MNRTSKRSSRRAFTRPVSTITRLLRPNKEQTPVEPSSLVISDPKPQFDSMMLEYNIVRPPSSPSSDAESTEMPPTVRTKRRSSLINLSLIERVTENQGYAPLPTIESAFELQSPRPVSHRFSVNNMSACIENLELRRKQKALSESGSSRIATYTFSSPSQDSATSAEQDVWPVALVQEEDFVFEDFDNKRPVSFYQEHAINIVATTSEVPAHQPLANSDNPRTVHSISTWRPGRLVSRAIVRPELDSGMDELKKHKLNKHGMSNHSSESVESVTYSDELQKRFRLHNEKARQLYAQARQRSSNAPVISPLPSFLSHRIH